MNHLRHLALGLLATASAAVAQVSYTGLPYIQDFNSLAGTTNNQTGVTWTDNSTLLGWYASKSGYGVTDGTQGGTAATFDSTSTAANIGLFSFGTAGSTDRALGSRATSTSSLGTTNAPVHYGVRLVNNTASTITRFSIMATGEQWFASTQSAAHTLNLSYQIGATSLSSGTWSANVATFTAPVSTGTTARALNGNTAANRNGIAALVTGISWAPGQELWIRIEDANESGNEQGLAIDDFIFTSEPDSSVFFNGRTSYLTMGAATATLGASAFTLEAWIYRTGAGNTTSTGTGGVTSAIPIIAKGRGEADGDNRDCNYFLGIDSATNRLVADFEAAPASGVTAGQNYPVSGTSALPFNTWTHVAATYDPAGTDGEKWKLFINGVKDTSSATSGVNTIDNATPRADSIQHFSIGSALTSAGTAAGFFQGLIDEVRVWNIARTPAEILAQKDNELGSGTGLLARYGLAEGTGTTASGTISGSPNGAFTGTPAPVWLHGRNFAPNTPPVVTLDAPLDGTTAEFAIPVTLTATATDSDGIAKVEFYAGATKIGEDTSFPYSIQYTSPVQGFITLSARAFDILGATTNSNTATIEITPSNNQPPTISLSGPADGATVSGTTAALQVSLSDPTNDPLTVTFYGRQALPTTPGPDFTLMTLPDTQFYSENTGGTRFANFTAQTNWIVSQKTPRNVAFVAHMGDMVQNGDNVPAEWTRANQAMSILENPTTVFQAYGIPWGGAPGNHDFGSGSGTGTTNFWNSTFGINRFTGRPYYGGSYGADNNNNFQLFSASGLDFIVINLAYRTSADPLVLDWADALLKQYHTRRAIVTSHWLIDVGNPAAWGGQGQAVYDKLKVNPNLFMMLCGHIHGEGRRADVFQGRTVHTFLQDYQSRANGGDGWLRYYTFSPATNQIRAYTYSPALNQEETDTDATSSPLNQGSRFDFAYDMQTPQPWVALGTVNVPGGGSTASFNFTGLKPGNEYEWYASVSDGVTNVNAAPTRRFTAATNAAPTITLDTPATGQSLNAGTAINLTTTVNDTQGNIAFVEFFNGSTKLGRVTTPPYQFQIPSAVTGTYAFSAVAVDDSNQATLSNIANITVVNPNNVPPSVNITSPVNNASIEASTITITANATDTDGTIAKVEFFRGAVKIGEDSDSPFSVNWIATVGNYALTAVATDNDGGVTTSGIINVTITPAGAFNGTYSQNFNSMGASGTVPPPAWSVWNASGGANNTWTTSIPASGVADLVVSSAALTASNTPTGNANNGYNAGAPGDATDRMLGSAPTSVSGVAFQLELTNLTGAAITAVNLGYDIRRFTAPSSVNELPGYWLFISMDGTNWTNVAALNPTVSGPTGVIVPNTVGVTNIPSTAILLPSTWANNATIRFRWVDDNAVATSPDQIFGLDNISVTLPTPIEQWKLANTGSTTTANTSDTDSDRLILLQEFAFGLNPNANDNTDVVTDVPNGILISRGVPTIYSAATGSGRDFRCVFIRRKNANDAGLIYTPQFSSDLNDWVTSTATPTVIASDAEVEVVSIRYPFFVNGKKAQYFRVGVTQN
jgi:hypothetical protein